MKYYIDLQNAEPAVRTRQFAGDKSTNIRQQKINLHFVDVQYTVYGGADGRMIGAYYQLFSGEEVLSTYYQLIIDITVRASPSV